MPVAVEWWTTVAAQNKVDAIYLDLRKAAVPSCSSQSGGPSVVSGRLEWPRHHSHSGFTLHYDIRYTWPPPPLVGWAIHITVKELLPIVMACAVWGSAKCFSGWWGDTCSCLEKQKAEAKSSCSLSWIYSSLLCQLISELKFESSEPMVLYEAAICTTITYKRTGV